MSHKFHVVLTADQRQELEHMVRTGTRSAQVIRRAQVLLQANEGPAGPAWTNAAITAAFGVAPSTIGRIRGRFVQGGLAAALHRRPACRHRSRRLDGAQEAQLYLLASSPAPEGRSDWSLRLLAQQVVLLGLAERISHETVRHVLKRGPSSPG